MNNETIRSHYDAFHRIQGFGTKHGGAFAAGSRGATLFAAMFAVVTRMEAGGVQKLSGTAGYRGGTDAKQLAAELLREDLREIRKTAEAIAEAEDTPEFDDQFMLPRSSSLAVLLGTAKAFLQDAAPHEALFLAFELPADFLADLQAGIARLEAADDDQQDGLSDQVGGTAELSAQTVKRMKIRKQLDAVVKNKFAGDAGILAEWATATHIVRPARKTGEETPVTA
jgi:hypothetical protein